MAKTVGFGILGSGLIAPFHARAVRDATGGKLVAVCDMARERLSSTNLLLARLKSFVLRIPQVQWWLDYPLMGRSFGWLTSPPTTAISVLSLSVEARFAW